MINLAMENHGDDDKQLDVTIDPEEILEAEWVTIKKVAGSLFIAQDKRNYTKACVQAYFAWLEYTQNQIRH